MEAFFGVDSWKRIYTFMNRLTSQQCFSIVFCMYMSCVSSCFCSRHCHVCRLSPFVMPFGLLFLLLEKKKRGERVKKGNEVLVSADFNWFLLFDFSQWEFSVVCLPITVCKLNGIKGQKLNFEWYRIFLFWCFPKIIKMQQSDPMSPW